MTKRICLCSRKEPMDGMRPNAIYASAACRTRDWKRRAGITGIRYVKASQNAKQSGKQVSYRKAVTAALVAIYRAERRTPGETRERIAEACVLEVLPTRQREQLERRSA
jgi:hypothetical protein